MLDASSRVADELALVLLPDDYVQFNHNLDSLRSVAIWQSDGHFKVGRNTALVGATLGASKIFHRPSVSQGLVKRFHKEVIPKK